MSKPVPREVRVNTIRPKEEDDDNQVVPARNDDPADESQDDDERLSELRKCLYTCDFVTQQEKELITNEGVLRLKDLRTFTKEDFEKIASRSIEAKRYETPRGPEISVLRRIDVTRLTALARWVKDQCLKNKPLRSSHFSYAVLERYLDKIALEAETKTVSPGYNKPPAPGKIQTDILGWIEWERRMVSYLSRIDGVSGAPLVYVIRDKVPEVITFASEREELIQLASHSGPAFEIDNFTVHGVLMEALMGTDAWPWVSHLSTSYSGRAVMKALREHYSGPGGIRKFYVANHELDRLFYESEQVLPFENYASKLQWVYSLLGEVGEVFTDWRKVQIMCGKMIPCTHDGVRAAMEHVEKTPGLQDNFNKAVVYLRQVIKDAFPARHDGAGARNDSAVDNGQDGKIPASHVKGRSLNHIEGRDLVTNTFVGKGPGDDDKVTYVPTQGQDLSLSKARGRPKEASENPSDVGDSNKRLKLRSKRVTGASEAKANNRSLSVGDYYLPEVPDYITRSPSYLEEDCELI